MFDQTFVDGVGKTNKSWTVAVSFALEFLAIGVTILIPLIWTGVLPKASLVNMLTAPAPPPPPAPPPQPVPKMARVVRRVFDGRTLQAPQTIPTQVVFLNGEPLAPLNTGVSGGLDLGGKHRRNGTACSQHRPGSGCPSGYPSARARAAEEAGRTIPSKQRRAGCQMRELSEAGIPGDS